MKPAPRACRRVVGVALLLLASVPSTSAEHVNFVSRDAELTAAAEAARRNSARFWTGRELPGDWSHPCRITIQPAAHAGGGATSFHFDRGEVSDWSMTVSGSRAALLQDVIPHEVDHMVRASLIRRPLPRWLDEGCATLMESPASHQVLRVQLREYLDTPLTPAFLDAGDYPADGRELARLYAVGFSLVEYLLSHGGSERLLAFQVDSRPPSAKLLDCYGVDVAALDRDWREWATARDDAGADCVTVHCPLHGLVPFLAGPAPARQTAAALPLLTVYTSEWCGPCRQFWSDLRGDPEFRGRLERRFRLQVVDVDRQPLLARQQQIDSVPTFVAPAERVIGYQGQAWLMERLQIDEATPPSAEPAPATALPSEAATAAPTPAAVPEPLAAPVAPVVAAPPENAPPSAPEAAPGMLQRGLELALGISTRVWPVLQVLGLVGGTAATGGVGAIVAAALLGLLRRRRARRPQSSETSAESPAAEGGGALGPAPFPRQLDEARQLLELRQSEGRVAVLDTLRGMFFDDELQKSLAAANPSDAAALTRLRTAIDARINDVAPLSTTLDV